MIIAYSRTNVSSGPHARLQQNILNYCRERGGGYFNDVLSAKWYILNGYWELITVSTV